MLTAAATGITATYPGYVALSGTISPTVNIKTPPIHINVRAVFDEMKINGDTKNTATPIKNSQALAPVLKYAADGLVFVYHMEKINDAPIINAIVRNKALCDLKIFDRVMPSNRANGRIK